MKKIILYIDTSGKDKVEVEIDVGRKREKISRKERAQSVLILIEEILRKNNLKPEEIDEIKIKRGPGSYTGLRIGAVVANTMGLILGILVNGKKGVVLPVYK